MPLGRTYTIDSGNVTVATTTQTPLLVGYPNSAAVTFDIMAIRVQAVSAGGATFPSNSTVQVGLFRTTGSSFANGTTVTPDPHNSSDIAANSVWKNNNGTAITGLTIGVQLWGMTLPFTAGANWAEWVTPGQEWRVPASATAGTGAAIAITCSSAGTSTPFTCELVFAE